MTDKTTTEGDTDVAVVTDGRKITWSYERKVGLPEYSSESFGIFITDHCPEDQPNVLAWASAMSEQVANQIKALVWDGLGLAYSYDAQGVPSLDQPVAGPGMAASNATTPPSPAPPPAAPMPPSPPPPHQVQPGTAPPRGQPRQPQADMAQYGVHAPFPGFCKKCGHTEFFDNRAEQDQKLLAGQGIGPDWKCKNVACGAKVYRPGSYPYNQAIKGVGAPTTSPPMQMAVTAAPPPPPPHPHPPMHVPPEPTEAPPESD